MSGQKKEVRLEGIVHASRYDPSAQGKPFLGAAIECSDGMVWVIDYSEQSPFHAFAGRQVVASGEPYRPDHDKGQFLFGWGGGKKLGHFRVSTMRLVEVTLDAEFVEVGAGRQLHGRFERGTNETGDSKLFFVTEEGNAFLVANDPAGTIVGPNVEVWAYPMQSPASIPTPPRRYLWIISPHSAADLWEWRKRNS
jgi:hypothetical protein